MVAGTTTRFALLLVLMLASSSSMLRLALAAAGLDEGSECLYAAGGSVNESPSAEITRSAAYRACIAHHVLLPGWASPVAPVILLVLASGLFLALPVWKTRRNRVIPLAAVDHDGRILRQLEQLAAVAGLERVPRVVVDPCAASTGAVVFGRNRRPTVCLHGGLLARRTVAPQDFEAVLLHELAHIRNGDVTLAYATVALWRVFIAAVLLPYAAGFGVLILTAFVQKPQPYQIGLPTWRALVLPVLMTVVVYLARSDVLRNREFHADLAAARWGADPHIWGAVAPAPTARVLTRAWRGFSELWRTHPRWDLRREALADSALVFEVPALPMFLTGTAAVQVNAQLWLITGEYGLATQWASNLAMALVPAALITGVVGVASWRAVVHRLLTERRRFSGARAGLWLGIGMTVGEMFANRIATFQWLPGEPVVVLLVVLAGMAFAWWVAQCAHLWATVWRGRTIHPPMVLVLTGACLALCAWFWWWQGPGVILANEQGLLSHPLGPGNESSLVDPTGQHTTTYAVTEVAVSLLTTATAVPLALPAVAVLWVVPVLAWAVRPQPRTWVRRAVQGTTETDVQGDPLPALRRALLAGLFGGVLCWAAVAGVKAYMHTWQPSALGLTGGILFQGWVSAAILAGVAVAAVAASLLVRRYPLIAALVAAQIAVLAGYGGMWALTASDGCIPALSTFTTACEWRPAAIWQGLQYLLSSLLVLATIVAIASAAVTSVVRRLLRRWTRSAIPPSPRKELRGLLARRLAVGVVCAAAIGVPASVLILPEPQGNSAAGQDANPSANPVLAAQASDQADAWYSLGGRDLVLRYNADLGRLRAISGASNASDSDTLSQLRSVCVAFGKLGKDASDYFPTPDPRVEPSWQTFTTMVAKSSQDCLSGLDQNDSATVVTGVEDLRQATSALDSVLTWVTAEESTVGTPIPKPSAPVASRLSGLQLQGALLPSTAFGKDFQMLAQTEQNSSTSPEPKTPRFRATAPCQELVGTGGNEGFGETSYAEATALAPNGLYYTQAVYEFDSTATASQTYEEMSATLRGCSSGETLNYGLGPATPMRYTLTDPSSPPGIGQAALCMDLVGKFAEDEVYSKQLMALDGTHIYNVDIVAPSPDELSQTPTVETVTRQLTSSITAAGGG
ncbi:M48 family metallopeptidase [Saccharothrix sp. ST-888]|uniref:M48 family metallopeptidase n=1 Tax=Saccharothrix sp. ST-888 TaxID=1427391 RepID=UPI0005EC6E89|nr:M48 family metalloprotease [Saccharothrix sp. ST-888]KJK59175.1 hypothetical protein UK12_05600 [Saccharothrix sp. ST-888]